MQERVMREGPSGAAGHSPTFVPCYPLERWTTGPLGILHVADVFLNPGIAGIGTDMPTPFGEKAMERAEVLYRACLISDSPSVSSLWEA